MKSVTGSLEQSDALARLVDGVDIVVHCAGAVGGADRADYTKVNVEGTRRLALAAARAGVRRFIHLSSMAAREPGLTQYAASKFDSELALASEFPAARSIILRPPAVYGPGDKGTLPLIRQLMQRVAVLPVDAAQRVSLIYVSDLAEGVLAMMAAADCPPEPLEICDGTVGGYSWAELATVAGKVAGHKTHAVFLPRPVAQIVARLARWHARRTGEQPILSPGKLPELYHRDWVCHRHGVTETTGWRARVNFAKGLAMTIDWYANAGLLPPKLRATRNPAVSCGHHQEGRQ